MKGEAEPKGNGKTEWKHATVNLLAFYFIAFGVLWLFSLCVWWIFSPAYPSWWSYRQTSSLCAWPLISSSQPNSHSCRGTEDTLSICCLGPWDRMQSQFTKRKMDHQTDDTLRLDHHSPTGYSAARGGVGAGHHPGARHCHSMLLINIKRQSCMKRFRTVRWIKFIRNN